MSVAPVGAALLARMRTGAAWRRAALFDDPPKSAHNESAAKRGLQVEEDKKSNQE